MQSIPTILAERACKKEMFKSFFTATVAKNTAVIFKYSILPP
jgi:hypothetical protein